jgi:hypothetical protein
MLMQFHNLILFEIPHDSLSIDGEKGMTIPDGGILSKTPSDVWVTVLPASVLHYAWPERLQSDHTAHEKTVLQVAPVIKSQTVYTRSF